MTLEIENDRTRRTLTLSLPTYTERLNEHTPLLTDEWLDWMGN